MRKVFVRHPLITQQFPWNSKLTTSVDIKILGDRFPVSVTAAERCQIYRQLCFETFSKQPFRDAAQKVKMK